MRVTLNDLSRLPVERLARLLLEWAAEDHSLLSRLHATLRDTADVGVIACVAVPHQRQVGDHWAKRPRPACRANASTLCDDR